MTKQEVIELMKARGFNAYERVVPEPQGHHVPAERFAPYYCADWQGELIDHDTVRDVAAHSSDGTLYAWRFCTITDAEWLRNWRGRSRIRSLATLT